MPAGIAAEDAQGVRDAHRASPSRASDKDILVAGAYNLGLIGIRNDETVLRFLDWSEVRVYDAESRRSELRFLHGPACEDT
jgi:hypothetical protein